MSLVSNLAWAAGLFDGEGCIFISRQTRISRPSVGYALKTSVSMVHLPTLERLRDVVGAGNVYGHRSGRNPRSRQSWQWCAYNKRAMLVLRLLRPFLTTKAKEADLALRYAELPKTYYPKGGRTADISEAMESLRTQLQNAKRYEWRVEA